MNYEIIQITTVRIILSIAYTKTLEIIFEAYLYINNTHGTIISRFWLAESSAVQV